MSNEELLNNFGLDGDGAGRDQLLENIEARTFRNRMINTPPLPKSTARGTTLCTVRKTVKIQIPKISYQKSLRDKKDVSK